MRPKPGIVDIGASPLICIRPLSAYAISEAIMLSSIAWQSLPQRRQMRWTYLRLPRQCPPHRSAGHRIPWDGRPIALVCLGGRIPATCFSCRSPYPASSALDLREVEAIHRTRKFTTGHQLQLRAASKGSTDCKGAVAAFFTRKTRQPSSRSPSCHSINSHAAISNLRMTAFLFREQLTCSCAYINRVGAIQRDWQTDDRDWSSACQDAAAL